MKRSKYNWIVEDNNIVVLFNGFTGAVSRIAPDYEKYIREVLFSGTTEVFLDPHCSDVNNSLISNGYLIEDEYDEIFTMHQLFLARKYSGRIDIITVIPTFDCNFACEYCFERTEEKTNSMVYIQEDVITKIKEIAEKTEVHFSKYHSLAVNRCLQLTIV